MFVQHGIVFGHDGIQRRTEELQHDGVASKSQKYVVWRDKNAKEVVRGVGCE